MPQVKDYGSRTAQENIADLGGLREAFRVRAINFSVVEV